MSERVVTSAEQDVAEGDRWYRAGRFSEAGSAYQRALEADPGHLDALRGAGSVALLGNDLGTATTSLRRLIERAPDSTHTVSTLQNLAEAAYRRDDFPSAGAWLHRLAGLLDDDRRRQIDVVARKLEAFAGITPYRADDGAREVRVPFEIVDPIPVVNVEVGHGKVVPFFIDTGGHETYLDRSLADELQVPTFGSTPITGAGGKQGTETHGVLNALTLGDLRIHDVPVKIMDFTALGFAEALGGVQVKGTIGTALLYHHLSTIDYPGQALILRPRTPDRLRSFEQQAAQERQQIVPFWLSGTHYILARGAVNDSDPMPLLVDTGGAGIAFASTKSTVERANISLRHDDATRTPGAGGTVQAVPFALDTLTLGEVTGRNLNGVYFPEADLEDALRQDGLTRREYSVGGIVSHQFFRPYALTFDFDGMRLFLAASTA
ncbi:aspartyl protease family protein [Saccharomonospora sp. NPDC046836]|uniref:aspartyl protease family protein n=1 Tax=Saccharomonospora sp. NPDC046836 TaxID=3156921 RepID=UPI0033EB758A